MRLAIVIGSFIAIILVSRWFSIPASNLEEHSPVVDSESQSPASDPATPPNANQPYINPCPCAIGFVDSESGQSQQVTGQTFELTERAKNVHNLVRAEYEVPRDAAEHWMKMKPKVPFEITNVGPERSEIVTLRVTTDERTQRAFCDLISLFYPEDNMRALTGAGSSNSGGSNSARLIGLPCAMFE